MRGKKGIWVLAVLAATLVFSGCFGFENRYKYTGTKTETKTFDLDAIETVAMRLGSADVEVVSKDVSEATFVIKKTFKATDEDRGKELLGEEHLVFKQEGSTLLIERKDKKRTTVLFSKAYISLDITATLPADVTLDLMTGSGDLDIDARTAPVKIRTGSGDVIMDAAGEGFEARSGSGDVRLDSAGGDVSFSTGSGDIYAGDIEGDGKMSTGSGDISIDLIKGDLSAGTGSGDVVIDASEGTAVVKTGSGDVSFGGHTGSAEVYTSSGEVEFYGEADEGQVTLRTSSGDVDVVIYGGESIELDISTSSGVIDTKVPIVVKEASRRRLHAISGDGRWKLKVSTSSGNVGVRRGSI
jgi:hypothetical protein